MKPDGNPVRKETYVYAALEKVKTENTENSN